MANEGRSDCGDFVNRVRADGRKPVVSADLWSKNGVALLGSLLHAMERPGNSMPWWLGEKLASARPCAQDRHTGSYVEQASFEEWDKVEIKNPPEDLFCAKTDRGSNMIKGYATIRQSPCVEHIYQRHARKYADHEAVAATLKMGRAIVGALNHSTIGSNDYQACWVRNLPPLLILVSSTGISQGVWHEGEKTRARSGNKVEIYTRHVRVTARRPNSDVDL